MEPKPSTPKGGRMESKSSSSTSKGGEMEPKPSTSKGGEMEPKPSTPKGGEMEPKSSTSKGGEMEPKPSTSKGGEMEPKPSTSKKSAMGPKPSTFKKHEKGAKRSVPKKSKRKPRYRIGHGSYTESQVNREEYASLTDSEETQELERPQFRTTVSSFQQTDPSPNREYRFSRQATGVVQPPEEDASEIEDQVVPCIRFTESPLTDVIIDNLILSSGLVAASVSTPVVIISQLSRVEDESSASTTSGTIPRSTSGESSGSKSNSSDETSPAKKVKTP